MVSRGRNVCTLHRLRRLFKGKWFLAHGKFAILKLNQGSRVCPYNSIHRHEIISGGLPEGGCLSYITKCVDG